MTSPVSMKTTCRVLIALHDEGDMTASQLAERLDLTHKQVSVAVALLCRKRKIKRIGKASPTDDRAGHQYVYQFCEEYEPTERELTAPRVRSKSATGRAEHSRAWATERVRANLPFQPVNMCSEKIALLRRILPRLGPDDRDIALNMIGDYERISVYRGAA